MTFEDFHKAFKGHLNVFRVESNHSGRIGHTLAKVHPQGSSRVYKERVDDGPRSVPTEHGSLLF